MLVLNLEKPIQVDGPLKPSRLMQIAIKLQTRLLDSVYGANNTGEEIFCNGPGSVYDAPHGVRVAPYGASCTSMAPFTAVKANVLRAVNKFPAQVVPEVNHMQRHIPQKA